MQDTSTASAPDAGNVPDTAGTMPPSDALASNDPAGTPEDAFSMLESYFASEGAEPQDGNPEGDEPLDASDPGEGDPEPEPPVEEPDTDEPEAQTDAVEAQQNEEPTDEPDSGANFDAIDQAPEFLDEAGIKAKYPRNANKALVAEAAQFSALAKEGHEAVQSLGGKTYIPGLNLISDGLRNDHHKKVFQGILETAGAEGVLKHVAETLDLGLIQAKQLQENPETAQFGKAIGATLDAALEARFGGSISSKSLEQAAKFIDAGWLEKIEKWSEEEYVDPDEVQQLVDTYNDPREREFRKREAEYQRRIEEKETQAQAQAQIQDFEIEGKFSRTVADEVAKVLTNVVWQKSPLKELANDTAEVKQEKALLRSVLQNQAIDAFNSNDARGNLLKAYKFGKSTTAVYQDQLATAIQSAVLQTKEQTSIAERMLAKLIGGTRNAQLAKKSARTAQPESVPTTPTQPEAKSEKPITKADVEKQLLADLEALNA